MVDFQVGDKVIGNDLAHVYSITKPGWIGEVIAIDDLPENEECNIRVRDDKYDDGFWVAAHRFDLLDPVVSCEIAVDVSEMCDAFGI